MKVRLAAMLAATAASGVFAVAAAGQEPTSTRSGQTAKGVSLKLELGFFGNPTSFTVGKTKVDCKQGGKLTTRKTTYTDFVTSDPGAFNLKEKTKSESGQFTFKGVTRASGKSTDEGLQNWSGALKVKTRVFRNGERIDVCRLSTTWEAH